MKKAGLGLFLLSLCCVLFAGCDASLKSRPSLSVYSFSGENEQFSISNGVIVLTPDEDIFYGGDLTEKQETLSDVVGYSITFYIMSGNEQDVLLSNSVIDEAGIGVELSVQAGSISGDVISQSQIDDLQNGLFLELKTTDANGEQHQYEMQLTVTEVTRNDDN